jgi:hypothetical protein
VEILANRFESSSLVAGNLYERLAGAGVDTLPLITEFGDQGQRALSLSKTVGFALQGKAAIDPSISVSPDA